MDIIEILKVVLLGIIEGITEWLPISSTGHMLLFDAIMPLNASEEFKEMFFVVIQLGAILAVIGTFWNKMFPFKFSGNDKNKINDKNDKKDEDLKLKAKSKIIIKKETFELWFKIVVACLPSAIGIFLDDYLETYFGTPIIIAAMLIIYGILFIIVERWNKKRNPKVDAIEKITYKTAFLIGIFQVLAMIPGTSRSGATIIGALILGVSRVAAAEFTFFMAVPTMLAASVFKLLKFGLAFTTAEIITLVIGMVVAFVVSIFAIKFLMKYIKKNDFEVFGWYRIVLGIIVLIYFGIVV